MLLMAHEILCPKNLQKYNTTEYQHLDMLTWVEPHALIPDGVSFTYMCKKKKIEENVKWLHMGLGGEMDLLVQDSEI